MARYHVNLKGEAGSCGAAKGNCPFGNESAHHDSIEEARASFEARMGPSFMKLKYSVRDDGRAEVVFNEDFDPELIKKATEIIVNGRAGGILEGHKVSLFGDSNDVLDGVTRIKAAEAARLADLRQPTRIGEAYGQNVTPQAQQQAQATARLMATWGDQGMRPLASLSLQEQAIAGVKNAQPPAIFDEDGVAIPAHTTLASYQPHMRGNHATWVRSEIKLDHESGNIYSVARVTQVTGSIMESTPVSVAYVENHGQDLSAAIEAGDARAEAALARLQESSRSPIRFPAPAPDRQTSTSTYRPAALAADRASIEANLASAAKKASSWNRVQGQILTAAARKASPEGPDLPQ